MVWLHGGGFSGGGNNELRLRGTALASDSGVNGTRDGTIVVVINYRLDRIGWMAHPAFATTGATDPVEKSVGNYGFLDQVAALRWVQDNIAAFGGDPSRVTIAGESAGGSSVCLHLVHPPSWPLFSQAVLESSACFVETRSRADAATQALGVAEALNCGHLASSAAVRACLRAVPWGAVLNATAAAVDKRGTSATVGGAEFGQAPWSALQAGAFAKVPLLLGNVAEEGFAFVPPGPVPPAK